MNLNLLRGLPNWARAQGLVVSRGSPGQNRDTKKPLTNKNIVVHTTAETIQKQCSM